MTVPSISLPTKRARFNWLGWLSLMDVYILRELLGPFLFGVGAFSSIGISIGLLFDLVRRITESGLPLTVALQVFALKLPEFVAFALPMSMLLAALMAYSRLSNDSELIALRSCGISTYRMIVPALIMSFAVTGLTFLFNESLVPAANYQASVTMDQALNKERVEFRDRNILYQQFDEVLLPDGSATNQLTRIFYARRYNGQEMQGVTILDFSRGGLDQIITSESAIWNDVQEVWDFLNGTIYLVAADGGYRNILTFDNYQLPIPRTPLDLASRNRDFGEMNIIQAQAQLQLLQQTGNEKQIRKLRVRIQEKYAFPFICVAFGLVGAALGIFPNQRTNKATAFGTSILIIFGYYLLAFICSALGVRGTVAPFVSAWLPIGCGVVVGGIILVRAAR